MLKNSTALIGTSTTSFLPQNANRVQNIITAAAGINARTLAPGEVFSTLAALGSIDAAGGYKMASVISRGKVVDDYGGGICQVSTTLYDAVLYAGIQVTQRKNHSLKVGYADYGFDATLAEDHIDLKFKNDLDVPVSIECIVSRSSLTQNSLTINIYGKPKIPAQRIVLQNEYVRTVKPDFNQIIFDGSLPRNQTVEIVAPLDGCVYNLYRLFYSGKTLVKKEQVNQSVYIAVPGMYHIGTKSGQNK